jgi:hypothetical protein
MFALVWPPRVMSASSPYGVDEERGVDQVGMGMMASPESSLQELK